MKTILSIDGGGIRGVIPLHALVRLESHYATPCREMFDMVAGTSTGAIIAAGLALGISARGLLAMYRELASKVFHRLPLFRIVANLGNHRYDFRFLQETLDSIGAGVPLNALPLDVMITGKNTVTGRTDFFVRDNPVNAGLWGTMSLTDAVLASIAAPTYFPPHTAIVRGVQQTWVDGGVGVAGNPCYQATVEALQFGAGRYQPGDVRLLSFGTGRTPHQIDAPRANIVQWLGWVLSEVLEDSGDWQTYITRHEYGVTAKVDFRRYQLDLSPEVMSQIGVDPPPGVDVGSIAMDSVWALDLLDQIGRAFADAIDFDQAGGLELISGAPVLSQRAQAGSPG
jgi:hypothetical protein